MKQILTILSTCIFSMLHLETLPLIFMEKNMMRLEVMCYF